MNRCRDTVRTCYERLGQVILEQCTCADLETMTSSLRSELDLVRMDLVSAQSHIHVMQCHLETLRKHQFKTERHIKALEERAATLEAEKKSANEEIGRLCENLSAHRGQILEIQQSRGWRLLNRAHTVRVRLTRKGSGSGRAGR